MTDRAASMSADMQATLAAIATREGLTERSKLLPLGDLFLEERLLLLRNRWRGLGLDVLQCIAESLQRQ